MSVNNRIAKMVDDDASFALLRANPKLTGNIKVVVDSDSNMYLDTFKVSLGLSQYKYRHIPINPSEYYGRTLMTKMKDLTSDEFYKVEDTCYNLFAMADDYDGQYYDKYNYGVRTNFDRLYKENFALLAPLCIRKNLPDFFLVFKFKNYNSFYNSQQSNKLLNLSNVTLVKSYDMRENTELGQYIRRILENASKFVGDVYTGYSYDHFNGYNGISLDRGVVSCVYESTVDERMFNSQVAMNNWYTLGFERNRMVSKDIINFEFMFSDETEELFHDPYYFGVYVRLNGEPENFSCIRSFNDGIRYNEFNKDVSGGSFIPSSNPDIIYGISTPKGFERLETNIKESPIVSEYCRKENGGLIATDIIDANKLLKKYSKCHYVSFIMKEPATPGEHYKIIDKHSHTIYEVVIRGGKYESDISDIYEIDFVNTSGTSTNYKNYRIFINNIPERIDNDPESNNKIKYQSKLISRAFNIFITNNEDNMDSYSDDNGIVSIIYGNFDGSNDEDLVFVWTCDVNSSNNDPISIFGLNSASIQSAIVHANDSVHNIYFPIGYEYMGDRTIYGATLQNITSMINGNISQSGKYQYIVNASIMEHVLTHDSILYSKKVYDGTTDEYNDEYFVFDESSYIETKVLKNDFSLNSIYNPCILGFGSIQSYLVSVKENLKNNSRIQIFENTPINAGVCSIFNIKDFYHDVIDQTSHFVVKVEDDVETAITLPCPNNKTGGEYFTTDVTLEPHTRGNSIIQCQEEYIHNYIDMYDTLDIDTTDGGSFILNSKDALGKYLINLQNNAHYDLDVSLIEPYCCKWRGLSTDYYGMRIRTMMSMNDVNYKTIVKKPYLIKDSSSYFIPGNNEYNVGFSSSGYGGYKYIPYQYTPSDIIESNEISVDDNLYTTSSPYNRFSKLYMYGDNEVEFVSAGVKVRISSSNSSLINLSNYVGYSIILILSSPSGDEGINLFVDETTEQAEVIIETSDSCISHIRSLCEHIRATIKKDYMVRNDVTFEQGLRINIIDPYEISRENSKFVETTKGSVHPVYCTPVMVDMFEFENVVESLGFGKDFNYANIKLNKINEINQTWLQKVPDINNSIQQSTGVETIPQTIIVSHTYDATQGDGSSEINIVSDKNRIYYAENATVGSKRVEVNINQSNITYNTEFRKTFYHFEEAVVNPIFGSGVIWQSNSHLLKDDYVYNYTQMTKSGEFYIRNGQLRNNLDEVTSVEIARDEIFYKRRNCAYIVVNLMQSGQESDINVGKTVYLFNAKRIDGSGVLHEITRLGSFRIDERIHIDNNTYKLIFLNKSIDGMGGYNIGLKTDISTPITYYYPDATFNIQNIDTISETDYGSEEGVDTNTYFIVTYSDGGNIKTPVKADLLITLLTPSQSIRIDENNEGIIYDKAVGGNEILKYKVKQNGEHEKEETKVTTLLHLTATSALTLYSNMNITSGYWYQNICRLFTLYDKYDEYDGYTSGYEKNCYIASKAITRYDPNNNNSNIIILDDWYNALAIDNVSKTVTIDITYALFEKIKSYNGFRLNWIPFADVDNIEKYKNKYIENAIYPNIKINNKNIFKIYADTSSKGFDFLYNKPYEQDIKRFTEVENVNNVLTYKNNRYYMTIYGLKAYSYYAEFYIEL